LKPMSLQNMINSRLGIGAILALGKLVPASLGYRLADWAATFLAGQRDAPMIRAARANQWVVTGQRLNAEELDEQVHANVRCVARILYDFYHTIDHYDAILQRVTLSPQLIHLLKTRLGGSEGTLMLAPHLSNFDLAGRAIALNGYCIQVLSYPQPQGGYEWQNRLRSDMGIEITPMTTENMRRAKERLRAGGGVISGLERPLSATNYYPKFFGCPAPLPVSYVRMALQTGCAVMVVACVGTPQENYRLECSDLIYMQPYPRASDEIERNAEKVLQAAEPFIRANPQQWAMFYPLWPFALDETAQ